MTAALRAGGIDGGILFGLVCAATIFIKAFIGIFVMMSYIVHFWLCP